MARTYYDLLDLPPSSPADEIKRAFRREIAKYHPDKVQHLGQEFQDIAVTKAAELTQAYQTLSDPEARAEYDAQLEDDTAAKADRPASTAQARTPPESATPRPADRVREPASAQPSYGGASVFAQDRAGALDLVRRAALMRFRQAIEIEFGSYQDPSLEGFDVTCVPKSPFWALRLPPRVLGRFLPLVDAAAVAETWAKAAKMKKDPQRDLCVFVMGPSMSPPGELARAIAEQRRKPMPAGGKLVMIPVDTKTWHAHVPTDAPPVVKSLLMRLKSA